MIDADRFYSNAEALTRDAVPIVARLMPGQIVVPRSLLEQAASLQEILSETFQTHGLQMRAFTVGADAMARDQHTGEARFDREPYVVNETILTTDIWSDGHDHYRGNLDD